MTVLKSVRELNRLAATFGFKPATITRGNHLEFRHAATDRAVFFSGTSGDCRAVQRLRQKFRAASRGLGETA